MWCISPHAPPTVSPPKPADALCYGGTHPYVTHTRRVPDVRELFLATSANEMLRWGREEVPAPGSSHATHDDPASAADPHSAAAAARSSHKFLLPAAATSRGADREAPAPVAVFAIIARGSVLHATDDSGSSGAARCARVRFRCIDDATLRKTKTSGYFP